ncbi:hypothetical protein [Burkholderia multivorans]|uniref:hypothetical protein n=1 Tax=Burkholderia multivorans TaxID=87883 RepID=UPI0021C1095F|nr:hypothetical protein [Burkholderia multivorans]
MKRPAMALASINGISTRSDSSGLTPAKAIQKDKAPLARRKSIQTNEALAANRQGRLAQLDALHTHVRDLITEISHAAGVELLDLMADDVGSFARHKAAQDARTWGSDSRHNSRNWLDATCSCIGTDHFRRPSMTANMIRLVPYTRRDGRDAMSIALQHNLTRGQ